MTAGFSQAQHRSGNRTYSIWTAADRRRRLVHTKIVITPSSGTSASPLRTRFNYQDGLFIRHQRKGPRSGLHRPWLPACVYAHFKGRLTQHAQESGCAEPELGRTKGGLCLKGFLDIESLNIGLSVRFGTRIKPRCLSAGAIGNWDGATRSNPPWLGSVMQCSKGTALLLRR